jgi:RNA polymerase sigma-70 factor, ECF subfamily
MCRPEQEGVTVARVAEETSESEDGQRLAALRAGNVAVTEEFVRENASWMLRLANRMVRDHGQAEDIVQAAFANVFKALETFEGRSALKTWMHRIVVNQALMQLRRTKRLQETPIDELLPAFDAAGCRIEEDWTAFETPEALLERAQTKAKILALIDTLPDGYRIVLLLRDIEELSTAEVAEMLELTEANVKVRLHRARAALKKLLEPLVRGQSL